jgi:long-chain acyl-CoA synthetase
VKPHFILSVPALAKTFKKNIENGIKAKGPKVVKMFEQAVKISELYHGNGNAEPKGWRIILKPLVALYDKILFSKVRENFGGHMKFFIGGGALLDKDLQKFYCAIGMPMFQ